MSRLKKRAFRYPPLRLEDSSNLWGFWVVFVCLSSAIILFHVLMGGSPWCLLGMVFLLLTILHWARGTLLLAKARARWEQAGIRGILVHSDSPTWKDHIRDRWLPELGDRFVTLNWSERKRWEPCLEVHIWRHFCGTYRNFNPAIILFNGLRRPWVVGFYYAFQLAKHGDANLLDYLESLVRQKLGEKQDQERLEQLAMTLRKKAALAWKAKCSDWMKRWVFPVGGSPLLRTLLILALLIALRVIWGLVWPVSQPPDSIPAIYESGQPGQYRLLLDDGHEDLKPVKPGDRYDAHRNDYTLVAPEQEADRRRIASSLTDGYLEIVDFDLVQLDDRGTQAFCLGLRYDITGNCSYVYRIQGQRVVPLLSSLALGQAFTDLFPLQLDEDPQMEFALSDDATFRRYEWAGDRWEARYDPRVEWFFFLEYGFYDLTRIGPRDWVRSFEALDWRAIVFLVLLLCGAVRILIRLRGRLRLLAVAQYLLDTPLRVYLLAWIVIILLELPFLNYFVGSIYLINLLLWPVTLLGLVMWTAEGWISWAQIRTEREEGKAESG
ncbi:MAG: hypothetical protein JXR96_26890 [Deltaproteobacteria bacterium]|nr:hypothetical protein [Deltaproteobacteria bacterium]